MTKTKTKSKTAKKKPAVKKRARLVALITGVKEGDPNKLAPQPCLMANIAYGLGEATRAEYLTALKAVIVTNQPVGRLFSFHKPDLIKAGYIKFRKVPRDTWLESQAKKDQPAAEPAPAVTPEPATEAPPPEAAPQVATA